MPTALSTSDVYLMPAEWEKQASIWLSWPHNKETWPNEDNKYELMIAEYCKLVHAIALSQKVNINVGNAALQMQAENYLQKYQLNHQNIFWHHFPTNDAWCRDHGPIFVYNQSKKKVALKWNYNAWGGKYPPFDLDNLIPGHIAGFLKAPLITTNIILEGGSIEVNGKGTLLTTSSCLLNKNRNPSLSQFQIEEYLHKYLGAKNILWLHDGIVGDDTDGHIDDITRFTNPSTLITVMEDDRSDENYEILKNNLELLKTFKDQDGKFFEIETLPMPKAITVDGIRLPASYANFLITNDAVLVPIFEDKNDEKALQIIQNAFPDRKVIGIVCKNIVWGLGTIHCLSQQEPI
ncbi:MAG: agmatine deiminase family protein [Bacteroidota bacterium]|nr:agmatine deiminase family protein [Bacteroidota bacterium]